MSGRNTTAAGEAGTGASRSPVTDSFEDDRTPAPTDVAGLPKLLRLKRTRAKHNVGYLCLRAMSPTMWMLTRNYHTPVFGIHGHHVWNGEGGHIEGVRTMLNVVAEERDASVKEFLAAIVHLERCALLEAQGKARPPRGFRPGWARAKLPTAIGGAKQNERHWTQNLANLKIRLEETGWPTSPLDPLLTTE